MLHRQRRIRRRLHCAGRKNRAHTCSLARPKPPTAPNLGPPEDKGQTPDKFKQTWDSILGLTKDDLHSEVMLNYRTWPLRAGDGPMRRGEPPPSALALSGCAPLAPCRSLRCRFPFEVAVGSPGLGLVCLGRLHGVDVGSVMACSVYLCNGLCVVHAKVVCLASFAPQVAPSRPQRRVSTRCVAPAQYYAY